MEHFWQHGWKWVLVVILGIIVLGLMLPLAHNLESGRDRDDVREERGRD